MSPLAAPPSSPGGLEGFPELDLPAGRVLARIHRRDHGPLWFSHDGEGRLDLPPPRGTLYLAAEPLGALVEVFREIRIVPQEDIAARRLSLLASSRNLTLADCTSRRARRFGLTAALHSSPAYDQTQAWAAALAAAGFDGIHYLVSHDPSQQLAGYALFGDAGEAPEAEEWALMAPQPIPETVLRTAREQFGLPILPARLEP